MAPRSNPVEELLSRGRLRTRRPRHRTVFKTEDAAATPVHQIVGQVICCRGKSLRRDPGSQNVRSSLRLSLFKATEAGVSGFLSYECSSRASIRISTLFGVPGTPETNHFAKEIRTRFSFEKP